LVSLEVHGSKISFYRNIFLSQYRNIVRQNVSCELGLKSIFFTFFPIVEESLAVTSFLETFFFFSLVTIQMDSANPLTSLKKKRILKY